MWVIFNIVGWLCGVALALFGIFILWMFFSWVLLQLFLGGHWIIEWIILNRYNIFAVIVLVAVTGFIFSISKRIVEWIDMK